MVKSELLLNARVVLQMRLLMEKTGVGEDAAASDDAQ